MKPKTEIENKISQLVEEISLGKVRADAVRPEDRILNDLGLDSLDYVAVMLGLEQWLGVKICEGKVNWSTVQTVQQLATLFQDNSHHES